MLGTVLATVVGAYVVGGMFGLARRGFRDIAYPSPDAAEGEIDALVAAYPQLCRSEVFGRSSQGRPLRALVLRAGEPGDRPRLLLTAHIHAVEYVGSYVARGVARRLVEGYGQQAHITDLLERAEIWIAPLLNPDGAERIWRGGGWGGFRNSRVTANGVDPNRNFPFVERPGRKGWNSAREQPGSAYYRGPRPLSEAECLALARLCQAQRFCAAIHFHSFSSVVFLPALGEPGEIHPDAAKAQAALDVFRGVFQQHQPYVRYRPVPERSAAIVGQLDPFLLEAFGTPSVTIEVSWPRPHLLLPWNTANFFWWANPARPEPWEENDAPATIHALIALLERTGGTPCTPTHPELADRIPTHATTD